MLLSLIGAYLIVVKRAYRSVATSMGIFLFGSEVEDENEEPAEPAYVAPAPVTSTPVAPRAIATDYTDDFILTQIARA